MKKYCFDTSGISNPHEFAPSDIYDSLWSRINDLITTDCFAVTTEIYDEMTHIRGTVGECIKANKLLMVLEVSDPSWDWQSYVRHAATLQMKYHEYISENNGNRAGTIGLNDLSIVALAKALNLPLVSMEKPILAADSRKRTIPNICSLEQIEHLDFNTFLRREGIKF